MKLRYAALVLASLIGVNLIAATSVNAQTPLIERVRLTDNNMSCPMIYGEIKQMESMAAAAPAAAVWVACSAA